jgi:GntR family transcriptional regulator
MPDPMYRQIADDLRDQIEEGDFEPDQPLPTEKELGVTYNASRNTVRQAIDLLTSWGLVETRPGSGTFIRKQYESFVTTLSGEWQPGTDSGLGGGEGSAAFKEVEARGRQGRFVPPRVEIQLAKKNVAERLRIPLGTNVISRHQQRFIDDQPWSLQTSYYPMSLYERGAKKLLQADDIPEGAVAHLGEVLHLKQVGYRDRIAVRRANDTELRFFGIREDAGIPMMVLLRTAYGVEGENGDDATEPFPFRFTESVFPGDRNQFIINAGEVPDRLAEPAEV